MRRLVRGCKNAFGMFTDVALGSHATSLSLEILVRIK
jgi:hypothetical protein